MTLQLRGYLRDNPGGAAVSGVTVNLLDSNTGVAPATTAFTNLSGTSAVTDANGMWQFTMDLCTGPLRVEALLGGSNKRHRRSDELFDYDGLFINQVHNQFRAFQDGVIRGYGGQMDVTAGASRSLGITTGLALIRGYALGWDTGTKTVTGSANGASGTIRWDYVVLRQWYNGTSKGKQDILIVQGGNAVDPVPTSTETDLTKFIQGPNIYDLPIARATLAFGATSYTVVDMRSNGPYYWASPFLIGIPGSFTVGDDLTVADTLTVNGHTVSRGSTQLGNTGADVVSLYGHIECQGTSPSVSTAANGLFATSAQSIVFGTDTSFEVNGTTKASGVTAGTAFVITFNQPRSSSNYVVNLQERTSGSTLMGWYVTSKGTAGFTIACTVAPAVNTSITLGVTAI